MKRGVFTWYLILGVLMATLASSLNASALELINNKMLRSNVNEQVVVKKGSNVVLNLNNHSILTDSVQKHAVIVEIGAKLTIEGSGAISATGNNSANIVNYGTTVIKGDIKTRELRTPFHSLVNNGSFQAGDSAGFLGAKSNGISFRNEVIEIESSQPATYVEKDPVEPKADESTNEPNSEDEATSSSVTAVKSANQELKSSGNSANSASEVSPLPAGQPVAISIGRIGLSAGVVPVGINADRTIATPDASLAGWFSYSAKPGDTSYSTTFIDGHSYGVFANLHLVSAGDRIVLTTSNGNNLTYVVNTSYVVPLDSINMNSILYNPNPLTPTLTIMTCSGKVINRGGVVTQADRLVVVASLI